MPITLPTTGFEEYAGDYATLTAAGWGYYGTPLDNTPGVPHAGAWCASFPDSTFLLYPANTWDGSGLMEKAFDNTFWVRHNAPRFGGGAETWEQPPVVGSIPEKHILSLLDGAGNSSGAYLAITTGGWNCCVVSEQSGLKYTTPVDSLPGDGTWHKLRVQLTFESTYGGSDGTVTLWIDDVLQRSSTGVRFSGTAGPYAATYGGIQIENSGGAGFTTWSLDDVNLVPAIGRARLWEVM
jgi:hypothetical protein